MKGGVTEHLCQTFIGQFLTYMLINVIQYLFYQLQIIHFFTFLPVDKSILQHPFLFVLSFLVNCRYFIYNIHPLFSQASIKFQFVALNITYLYTVCCKKYEVQQPPYPIFLIVPMIFLFSASALLNHSAFHTNSFALYRILSCAPNACTPSRQSDSIFL